MTSDEASCGENSNIMSKDRLWELIIVLFGEPQLIKLPKGERHESSNSIHTYN